MRGKAAPLRALVIGAGPAAAHMHLPVLARLRDRGALELACICDIRGERAAAAKRKFGFLQTSGDANAQLARTDIDVVYIFAGALQHFIHGLQGLNAGKHLFVEKPIAPSFAQARELAEAAGGKNLVAVGGHNRRFFASLAAARARAGKAGWRFAEARFHKPEFGRPPAFGARTWLSANGIHALDALVFMMGAMPEHVTALADGVHAFSAQMRWSDGAQATFLCDNNAGARQEEYVFHGLGETCRITDAGLIVESNGAASTMPCATSPDGVEAEHTAFLDAIESGVEPRHSIAALAPSLFLAERIEESFNGALHLPPWKGPSLPRRRPPSNAVLIIQPAEFEAALAMHGAPFQLVTLEDVRRSSGPRTDIAAALLGRSACALPAETLEKLPNLALAGFAGLSLRRLAPEVLLARGVALVHASAAYAQSVAEFALALAILGRRRAFASNRLMQLGGWGTDRAMQGLRGGLRRSVRRLRPSLARLGLEPFAQGAWRSAKPLLDIADQANSAPRDLKGAHVGLLGWGANARAFAERLAQAGANVRVWSQHAPEDIPIERVSLGEALASDIVSLHRGLTPATRHFLGAAELEKLRPGTVLINVARGALIEPAALVARLRRGDIVACLDTFEEEPLAAADPLRDLPNVFLTSHIAGGSAEMHAAAAQEVVGKVAAYLEGTAIESVSPARLGTMS